MHGPMSAVVDNDFRAVAEFIEQQTGFPQERIQPTTTLLVDVAIDGEDAEKFFLAFGKRFGVALGELNFSRHFGGEGFPGASVLAIPIKLILHLLGRDIHKQSGLEPICVEQLVQAVKSKRWPDVA
jgi:hypothetical protein